MLFKINWLTTIFSNYKGQINEADDIDYVTIDSREELHRSLFIPIEGERFDGHNFLEQAIQNGAVATFWHEHKQLPPFVPDHFPVFFVSNTTEALQQLAFHYRMKIDPTVIGITGSNGKTTTKDLTRAILQTTYKTHATEGNLNNEIGLPLTILKMPTNTEMLIVEMGMNDFFEIDRLTKIAKPDFAVITNIGESHIEHLGSREGILKAKLEIMNGLKENGFLFTDGDEPLLNSIHRQRNVIKCGFGINNDFVITNVNILENGTQFLLNEKYEFAIPLYGKHHALNASFAIALGQTFDINETNIKKGLKAVEHTSMRFQFLKSVHGATLINDAYNASPTSMKGAIDVIKQFDQYDDKIIVLGDILELGEHAERLHESVAQSIKEPITTLLTYGNHAKTISAYVNNHEPSIRSKHFSTKDQLVDTLNDILHEKAIVLFKASRGMAFESIVNKLI